MTLIELSKVVRRTQGAARIINHTFDHETNFITATINYNRYDYDWADDCDIDELVDTLFHECKTYQVTRSGWAFDLGNMGVYLNLTK